MLISETINSAWRIRTKYDAMEAGVLGDRDGFTARNNLAVLLGGQRNAEVVLSGLLNTSLFVEETKRSIKQKSEEKGIDWRETDLVDAEIIFDLIGNPAEHFIDSICAELREVLNNWLDIYLEYHADFIISLEQEIDSDRTRFNQLVELARNVHPSDKIGKLQWFWLVAVTCTSKSSLDGSTTIISRINYQKAMVGQVVYRPTANLVCPKGTCRNNCTSKPLAEQASNSEQ